MKKLIIMAAVLLLTISAYADETVFELVRTGTGEQIAQAIEAGADANERGDNGWTPLMLAASNNTNPEVLTVLINAGAEVNARDEYGFTPLMLAAQFNENAEVLTVLINAGAEVNARTDGGATSLMFAAGLMGSCSHRDRASNAEEPSSTSLAVFVPGVVAGSPMYEMLVEGVKRAASERENATVKVVEGGFNQGEWADGVTSLAATGEYDCIITSNPALPEICERISEQFPNQKFAILDGFLEGNDSIYTLLYNQMEQAYLIGHMAGLITTSDLDGANSELRVGLIAGQEYPIMNSVIRIGYELGMTSVDPNIVLDFRVVGNWYDAAKASELAAIMYGSGVDVILAIAGGANQGVLAEANRRGAYVLWYDSNGYSEAPGIVLGSSALEQERAAYEIAGAVIDGTIVYGKADIFGVGDGYVTFIENDQAYLEHVPESMRERQSAIIESVEDGRYRLVMPTFPLFEN